MREKTNLRRARGSLSRLYDRRSGDRNGGEEERPSCVKLSEGPEVALGFLVRDRPVGHGSIHRCVNWPT